MSSSSIQIPFVVVDTGKREDKRMYETNTIEIDGLLPEDCGDDSLSLLDKSLTQQYKLSAQRASNESSNIILDNVWGKNSEALRADATGDNLILKTALSLLPNSDISHVLKWESCYHAESDFTSMISTSLKSCEACNNKYPKHIGFEKFINHKCSCNLNVPEPGNSPLIKTGTKNSMVQMLSSEGSCEEIKLMDEQRHSKTTFRHQRPVKIMHPVQKNIARSDETDSEEDIKAHKANVARITFKTAKEQLLASNPAAKRSLGATRKAQGKFISPMLGAQEKQVTGEPEFSDERLKHIDPKMVELIESEIIDRGTPIGWDDIAGLQLAKSVIQEAVVWPMLRPDIFTGLRQPPKGILLFGPPGTGKTLIGKCVAAQCNATFFSISASSLTSKWIGDGEKMVRALFAVARCRQPAVIFIDEIDSLLTQRSDSEHEATRRIKTEFLVQFDGAAIGEEDRILIVGATNRPQELDEAARRRLVKRLYIPLPDADARRQIISNLLKNESNILCPKDISDIATLTEGYSGADMKSLCSEAAMGPIRSVPLSQIVCIDKDKVRPVCVQDFTNALERVKPSVSQDDLGQYSKWNKTYGQGF